MTSSINQQILLKSRPLGEPKESDFALVETPILEPGEGDSPQSDDLPVP